MKLLVKRASDLTEADVISNSVWATFYEPDEFELLEELGFDRSQAMAELAAIGYSDQFVFPLPARAASLPFKHLYLSAQATTPAGTTLVGLRSSTSLSLIYKSVTYRLNKALPALSEAQAEQLASALGESALLPLKVTTSAKASSELFCL